MTRSPNESDALSGVVNLLKPLWASSAKHVYRLRKLLGVRKVGHAGSLDPFADGVLLGCVGKGTKLVPLLMGLDKTYRTVIRLGVTNDTYDTERPFEPVAGATAPSRDAIDEAISGLVGEIEQVPPTFSAVKIGGVPSYRLAKRGQAIEKPAKFVRIDSIVVEDYSWPSLTLRIACGRGTYIRAIARDLGRTLTCGACCEQLSRLSVGPFSKADSVNLETASAESVRASLISIEDVKRLIGV